MHLKCRHSQRGLIPCRATALLDRQTLQVLSMRGQHTCEKDPLLKYEIQAKSEMKDLAGSTNYSYKEIFDQVRLKYPAVAPRLKLESLRNGMKLRKIAAGKWVPPGPDTKVRPYECGFGCGKAYTDRKTCRKHERKKHRPL